MRHGLAFAIASGVTILLVTLVPAMLGPVRYDPLLVVNLVMTIAVIATAIYAAASVAEFRSAREAEYTPVLDLVLRIVREKGMDKRLLLGVRNIGRGAAAGVEAAIWFTDKDMVMWLPKRVALEDDLLLSGDSTSGELEFEGLHAVVQKHFRPTLPAIVLQLRYRDALQREVERFLPYDLPGSEDETTDFSVLQPSPQAVPTQLKSVEGKQRLLNEVLATAAEETGLLAAGLTVSGDVTRKAIRISVRDGKKDLWQAQTGPGDAIYHFAEWLNNAAANILAAHAAAEAGPPDPDGT